MVLDRKNKNIKAGNKKDSATKKKLAVLEDLPDSITNPSELPPDAPTFHHYASNNLFGDNLSNVARSTVESRVLNDPNLSSLDDSDDDEETQAKWKEQKKSMSRVVQRTKEKKLREKEAANTKRKLTMGANSLALQKADAATLHAQAASDLAASNRNAARLAALDAAKGIISDEEYNILMRRTVKDLFAEETNKKSENDDNDDNKKPAALSDAELEKKKNDSDNNNAPAQQTPAQQATTNFHTPSRRTDPYVHGTTSYESSPELILIGIKNGVKRRVANEARAQASAEKNKGVHLHCCAGVARCSWVRKTPASIMFMGLDDRYCVVCHKMAHYTCATFDPSLQADICSKCFDDKWD